MNKHQLSIAPMLDWTDKHYRYMARQISKYAWLYTEMIHANAIVYGKTHNLLTYHEMEHPLALQLGGSDPKLLAQATKKAVEYQYDEINLNCGCPSPRVQKGVFGACLMQNVELVIDCLNAMQDAAPDKLVTIKHRIGLDSETEYQPLLDFVGALTEKTACRTYIVHARNAWLEGLSPKENRDIPPLRYDFVYRLKKELPHLEIVINGGIVNDQEIAQHLQYVDGVMIGREAYHNPMIMQTWDNLFYHQEQPEITHEELVQRLYQYVCVQLNEPHTTLRHMARHYLGIMHGLNGARIWRRMLSDATLLQANRPELLLEAWAAMKNDIQAA